MSIWYQKGFCVRCLKDKPRQGGIWKNRMFICAECKPQ